MRAGDSECNNATTLIQQAHADGVLDLTESDERLAAAYSSRTGSKPEVVVVDLSPLTHGDAVGRPALRSKDSERARRCGRSIRAIATHGTAHRLNTYEQDHQHALPQATEARSNRHFP
ncbi:DUF1707 SHOCT-like domain-containing protein [Nocardia grenadensis]|uniref:DUF1707 SHOCT-like domain-containing protein n=1 Tax=Nocardia grenadensis TaxID=931537 RepID=UPI003D8E0F64